LLPSRRCRHRPSPLTPRGSICRS